jgi:uncharacterized membrane protein YvbJ
MVYCVKCGTNNPDDAQVCTKCGAQLYTTGESRHYRRMEDECFGIPRGGKIVGLAIGIIILLTGALLFLRATGAEWANTDLMWPFAVIIFGVLIIVGAFYGMRRRY